MTPEPLDRGTGYGDINSSGGYLAFAGIESGSGGPGELEIVDALAPQIGRACRL